MRTFCRWLAQIAAGEDDGAPADAGGLGDVGHSCVRVGLAGAFARFRGPDGAALVFKPSCILGRTPRPRPVAAPAPIVGGRSHFGSPGLAATQRRRAEGRTEREDCRRLSRRLTPCDRLSRGSDGKSQAGSRAVSCVPALASGKGGVRDLRIYVPGEADIVTSAAHPTRETTGRRGSVF
jgi:hypothetical protein